MHLPALFGVLIRPRTWSTLLLRRHGTRPYAALSRRGANQPAIRLSLPALWHPPTTLLHTFWLRANFLAPRQCTVPVNPHSCTSRLLPGRISIHTSSLSFFALLHFGLVIGPGIRIPLKRWPSHLISTGLRGVRGCLGRFPSLPFLSLHQAADSTRLGQADFGEEGAIVRACVFNAVHGEIKRAESDQRRANSNPSRQAGQPYRSMYSSSSPVTCLSGLDPVQGRFYRRIQKQQNLLYLLQSHSRTTRCLFNLPVHITAILVQPWHGGTRRCAVDPIGPRVARGLQLQIPDHKCDTVSWPRVRYNVCCILAKYQVLPNPGGNDRIAKKRSSRLPDESPGRRRRVGPRPLSSSGIVLTSR